MSKYLDERYRNIMPYTPGEQLRGRKVVKLNTNENPFPPAPGVLEAVKRESATLHLYPDITGGALMQQLADWFHVERSNVFIGNGSDEILAFTFQALCQNGAVFADITYGFYSVYANLYQVDTKIVPLQKDFSIGLQDYTQTKRTVFIANPNAPTGLALSRDEIRGLLERNKGLVVIDEAYVDFGAESCVPLIEEYDNLLVIGTFSKSRSLAGARLGYALASESLISDLERIRFSFNPYNVNQLTLSAGCASLQDSDYFKNCCSTIVENRNYIMKALNNMGFNCTNSKANFVFAKRETMAAQEIYAKLKERDILVRWFDLHRISNYLRITIGSKEQLDTLLNALEEILGSR